jgi:hypothetical protein
MASTINNQASGVSPDTPVTVLVTFAGEHQRLRFPLRDVSPDVFLKNVSTGLPPIRSPRFICNVTLPHVVACWFFSVLFNEAMLTMLCAVTSFARP